MERTRKRKGKKKRVIKRILLTLLLFLIIIGASVGYTLYKTYQSASNSYLELERGEKSKLRENAVKVNEDPFSLLLMGVEDYSTNGENGRTDTLILLTINPKDESIKMLSIPRDTRVLIPEKEKKTKINHAYAYGGRNLTIETVEDFLNIPIDYYAEVNFRAFKEVVDELNGVTVNVPFDFWENSDEDNRRIYFKKGEMTLDGEEALAYARMRKRDPRGDFGRNDRQTQIISAMLDKATAPSNIFKLDDIAAHIGKYAKTNFKVMDALALQQKYPHLNSSNIGKLKLEGEDKYINNVYYFIPNEESIDKLQYELKKHLRQSQN
ncbi:LCP family protein [Metabacillus fastidiosus]|uniref:LCP family protein n=1 Tax=Metabacillus fastidiosus TaxID=1458 RepID=UPI003D2C5080